MECNFLLSSQQRLRHKFTSDKMSEPTTADQWKAKGNDLVAAKKWQDACDAYTQAIDLGHQDKHACYGNRSMTNLKMENFTAAVADANCAIDAKETWWKGYSRLGAALQKRGEWNAAEDAYKSGLLKVSDSTGKNKLNEGLLDAQRRRPGSTVPAGGGRTNTLKTVQSYLRWFIIMNAIVYMIPFVGGMSYFRNCLLGCVAKYCITLSYHGRPSMSAEYGVKVVGDLSMHYLFLCFIMIMIGKPNVLVLFPLVTPDIYLLAGEMSETSPALSSVLSKPLKLAAKTMYGTDDYVLLSTQILAFNCMAEIGLGVVMIFEMITPQRNVIATVILWQFLRTRYMLMDDMKTAFRKLNQSITHYVGTIPVIGGIWKMIVKFGAYMSQMPNPKDAGKKSMFSSCTVM